MSVARDRAEQVALLVGPALERDLDAFELLDQRFLLLAALALLPLDLLAAGLDLLDVARRRLDGQVLAGAGSCGHIRPTLRRRRRRGRRS